MLFPAEVLPIVTVLAGRPNAGKSTLVNAMLGEERMITGPEAGITRDSITLDWTWQGREVRLDGTEGDAYCGKLSLGTATTASPPQ